MSSVLNRIIQSINDTFSTQNVLLDKSNEFSNNITLSYDVLNNAHLRMLLLNFTVPVASSGSFSVYRVPLSFSDEISILHFHRSGGNFRISSVFVSSPPSWSFAILQPNLVNTDFSHIFQKSQLILSENWGLGFLVDNFVSAGNVTVNICYRRSIVIA